MAEDMVVASAAHEEILTITTGDMTAETTLAAESIRDRGRDDRETFMMTMSEEFVEKSTEIRLKP